MSLTQSREGAEEEKNGMRKPGVQERNLRRNDESKEGDIGMENSWIPDWNRFLSVKVRVIRGQDSYFLLISLRLRASA